MWHCFIMTISVIHYTITTIKYRIKCITGMLLLKIKVMPFNGQFYNDIFTNLYLTTQTKDK